MDPLFIVFQVYNTFDSTVGHLGQIELTTLPTLILNISNGHSSLGSYGGIFFGLRLTTYTGHLEDITGISRRHTWDIIIHSALWCKHILLTYYFCKWGVFLEEKFYKLNVNLFCQKR